MKVRSYYEFFAGGGMARAGLGEGWSCLFANDIDPKKAASYAANWGDEHLKVGDVSKLSTKDLPGTAGLAWASFPCQDLSLAGSGAGLNGHRSGTFWPFWNLVKRLGKEGRSPSLVVLENVCGALASHGGKDFAAIGAAIAAEKYRFGALVIDAVRFLPQSRPRLFIVCVREGIDVPDGIVADEPRNGGAASRSRDGLQVSGLQERSPRLPGYSISSVAESRFCSRMLLARS